MKKVSLTMLAAAMLALSCMVISCNDFLTTEPTGAIENKDAYKTYEDCVKGVDGVYSGFKAYITRPIIFDAMTNDIIYARWGTNALPDIRKWEFSSGNPEVSSIWSANFAIINRANTTLYGMDTVATITPFTKEQQQNINRYKGEVYLARAMATFDLLCCFADRYDENTAATDLGVPDVRAVYLNAREEPKAIGRSTVEETLQSIDSDLDSANVYLPKTARGTTTQSQITTTSTKYFSRAAMFAVKSRLELYRGNYKEVVKCRDSIDIKYGFKLLDISLQTTEFQKIWWQDDLSVSKEVIWMVALTSADARTFAFGGNYNNSSQSSDAAPNFLPSGDLMNAYEGKDFRSPERGVYFERGVALAKGTTNEPVTLVGKYPSSMDLNKVYYLTNSPYIRSSMCKYLRFAEVWLNAVEALYRMGDETSARNALNYFRERRNATGVPSGITSDALLEAIKLERRREFAFEGMRWFDLKRWGDGVTRSADDASQTKYMNRGDEINIRPDNYHWTFPIPLREMNSNPAMSGQQNPNY